MMLWLTADSMRKPNVIALILFKTKPNSFTARNTAQNTHIE